MADQSYTDWKTEYQTLKDDMDSKKTAYEAAVIAYQNFIKTSIGVDAGAQLPIDFDLIAKAMSSGKKVVSPIK